MRRIEAELPDPLVLEPAAPAIRREAAVDTSKWPVVAIVGRPNVGKSTLFNRLTSSRRSIVGDEPGITRDRIYGEIEWAGQHARVVDTGGILPDDPELIPSEIFRQARVALDEAESIVMVVDGRTPLAAPDYDLARLLLRGGKPLLLAVNKIDTERMEEQIGEYRRLGIREVLPISAEHGVGIGDLLDHVFATLTFPETKSTVEAPTEAEPEEEEGKPHHRTHGEFQQHETSIAIIGRPNVGKSTLLNVLTGSSRAIVSPVAGTTRDAVDEVIEYDGGLLRFVDTAGIRRKGKTKMMAEKLSVVMARRHLEAADVALLIIDATEGVTSSDATIGGYAHESGRSVILVVNKWDLVTTGRTDGKPPADKVIFEEQVTQGTQIPGLCARGLYLRRRGQEHPHRAQAGAGGGRRAAQARLYRADESLPGKNRFPARHRSRRKQDADLLHDPGCRGASHLHPVYQQAGEAAFRLPALPGKPDTRRFWLSRFPNLVQSPRPRQVKLSPWAHVHLSCYSLPLFFMGSSMNSLSSFVQ